jgi:WD40 repeat protein
MSRQREWLLIRIVLALLFCGGVVEAKRALFPTDSDYGIILTFRGGEMRAVALDPTGTRLAIVDGYGGVRIVGATDGQERQRLPTWEAPNEIVGAPELIWNRDQVVFSPDGHYLAQAGQRGLRVWALDRDALITLAAAPVSSIGALSFLPDGQLQVRATIGGIYRWRLPDGVPTVFPATPLIGQEVWAFGGQGRWSLLCNRVASGDFLPDMAVTVSDIGGDEVERVIVPQGGSCSELVLGPDGTMLAARSLGNQYHLLDWRAGRVRHTIQLDSASGGGGIGFSPDGSRVLLGGEGAIRVILVRTGWGIGTVRALPWLDLRHPVGFSDVQMSADGRLVVALCGDIALRVWRV